VTHEKQTAPFRVCGPRLQEYRKQVRELEKREKSGPFPSRMGVQQSIVIMGVGWRNYLAGEFRVFHPFLG